MNSATLAKFILIALILLLPALPVLAANIEVNDTCNITDAIKSANTNASVGGCTAGDAGEDTITLTKDDTMTATGSTGISITQSLVINGQGHTLTNVRYENHFNVSSDITLTLNRVVFTTHGESQLVQDGGVMEITAGTVNVNDSVFHGNRASSAGGVFNIETGGRVTINRSVFYNNSSPSGGVIRTRGAKRIAIYNSLFYNNSQSAIRFYSLSVTTAEVILDHVTIVNNSNDNSAQAAGISTDGHVDSLTLRNSIIYGNTGGHEDCLLQHNPANQSKVVLNNIIGAGHSSCNLATQLRGNPRLPDTDGATSVIHLVPPHGSPAIDAADCITGVTELEFDFVNAMRPHGGSRCDIGAYETVPPPPPPPDDPPPDDDDTTDDDTNNGSNNNRGNNNRNRGGSSGSGDSGGNSGSSGGDSASDVQAPAAVIIPTCLSLPSHISVSNITHLTQCQQVNAAGIGNAAVLGLGFRDGVDVWGWVLHDTQVCFEGSSGSFRFLDAATAPRAVSELPAFLGENGMICATIDRAGTVALVNGPPVPAPSPTPPVYQSLSGCMVTTTFILNMRAAPAGDVIGAVPYNATLTALERTDGWFKVDYHGAKGWISAAYVEPIGTCG